MSRHAPEFDPAQVPADLRVAVIVARFNAHLTDRLAEGCLAVLGRFGVSGDRLVRLAVPGSFELPFAAQRVCRSHGPDAVVCLGAVVRGDTPHFEHVCRVAADGVARVALDESVPVIFGVLTCNTEQQALDRLGGPHGHAGERAAEAAVEMAMLGRPLG